MLHQITRRLGKQPLATVSSTHNASGVMHVQAHIALRNKNWFTRMQPHAYPHHHAFWPGKGEEGTLSGHRRQDRIGGACKGHKKSVTLRVHLTTVPLVENATQKLSALRQHVGKTLAQLLEQARRSLDVGEEQGDGSCWEVGHARPPSANAQ